MSRVVILMGSPSDQDHAGRIASAAEGLGLDVVQRIGSAHRVPEYALKLLRDYDNDDVPTVFITVAGLSDALSGVTDCAVQSPVIACPPGSTDFGGLDVLSSLRMPPGVAAAVVLHPKNAALIAAKMLALHDPSLRDAIAKTQLAGAQRVLDADAAIQEAVTQEDGNGT